MSTSWTQEQTFWIRSRRGPAVVSERLGTLVRNLTTDRRNRCARSCKLPRVCSSSPLGLVPVSTQQTQWQRTLSDSLCGTVVLLGRCKKAIVHLRSEDMTLCHGIRPEGRRYNQRDRAGFGEEQGNANDGRTKGASKCSRCGPGGH